MKKYRTALFMAAALIAVSSGCFASGKKNIGKQPRDEQAPAAVVSGMLSADGKSLSVSDKTLKSVKAGQSVVVAVNGGKIVLSGVILSKSGDSSDPDQSNFSGMNAAALAASGGQLVLENVQVLSGAEGANAVFSTGSTSKITVKGLKVHTTGNSSRGLDATYGGTIEASDVDITTEGEHCAPLATDRGEGTVTVDGGTLSSSGDGSPNIYSTGTITARHVTGKATGSEIAVIEGKNSITIDGCKLTGAGTHGIMLYQSFSGDADSGTSVFTALNSELASVSDGPFFYVTNTQAKADISGCTLTYPSGTLVCVSGNDGKRGWGQQGSNGGTFSLAAHSQKLSGNITCDSISSMDFMLGTDSSYTGTVNGANEGTVSVTVEKSAVWNVTGDSYLSVFKDTDAAFSNIKSGGHTVYYDVGNAENAILGGKTIELPGGGKLVPYKPVHKTAAAVSNMGNEGGAPDGMQNGMPGGPDGMKMETYTGKLSVNGKKICLIAEAVTYTVSLPQPPAGKKDMKPAGDMDGGPDGMPPDMDGAPDAGGMNDAPGAGGRPQPGKMLSMDELRKLNGKTVVCTGQSRKAQDGTMELIVFGCKEKK